MTSITIPNSVTKIESSSFNGCSALTTVTIPNSVTYIGEEAFANCPELLDVYCYATNRPGAYFNAFNNSYIEYATLHVPESAIGDYSSASPWNGFKNFVALSDINGTFYETLTVEIDGINYKLWGIGNTAEVTKKNAQYSGVIDIPAAVTFNGVTYDVTSIGNSAFYSCTGLTSVTIPSSVYSIGSIAFYNCTLLTAVTVKSTTPINISSDTFSNYKNVTLYVPKGSRQAYQTADYWKEFKQIIESPDISVANADGVTIYYSYTNDNTELAVSSNPTNYSGNVVIPESVTYNGNTYSVTSIEDYAFQNCISLTIVTIPNSVTNIGSSAFSGCKALTSVVIEDCETALSFSTSNSSSNMPFYNCPIESLYLGRTINYNSNFSPFESNTNLKTLTLSDFVTIIQNRQFCGCSGLTSVTIPNSVTRIGSGAFQSCAGLTSVSIPNSVTSIGNSAFYNTSWYNNQPDGLVYAGKVAYKYKGTMPANSSITLKEGTLCIAESAFYYCRNLTSVSIPNSVTSIETGAFYGCTGLTSVIIPNSVTSIGIGAFQGCYELKSVTLPNLLKDIVKFTFAGCSNLLSIIIPNSINSIGDFAFAGCRKLSSIIIPNSVNSIGDFAFAYNVRLSSINIENSNTTNGVYCFGACPLLVDEETLPTTELIQEFPDVGIDEKLQLMEKDILLCESLLSLNFLVEVGDVAYDIMQKKLDYCSMEYAEIIIKAEATLNAYYSARHQGATEEEIYQLYTKVINCEEEIDNSISKRDQIINDADFIRKHINSCDFTCNDYGTIVFGKTEIKDESKSVLFLEDAVYDLMCNPPYSYYNLNEYGYGTKATIIAEQGYYPKHIILNGVETTQQIFSTEELKSGSLVVEFARIDPNNELALSDVSSARGSRVQLPVVLKNDKAIVGLQFELVVPEGVTVATQSNGNLIANLTNRANTHSLTASKMSDNVYKFVIIAANQNEITGNDGAVLNVTLETDEDMAERDYELQLNNVELIEKTSNGLVRLISVDDTANLSVEGILMGDSNGDGEINIVDAISLINYIMNKPSSRFIKSAADISGDGEITVFDVMSIINKVLSRPS